MLNLMMGYKLYILILILTIGGYFIFTNTTETTYKCPENFATNEEYVSDVARFISEYTKANPNATEEDLIVERDRLFIENNCIDQYLENRENYPDWCPISNQEINATLDYLSVIEYEEAMNILEDLSDKGCNDAVDKIVSEILRASEPTNNPD